MIIDAKSLVRLLCSLSLVSAVSVHASSKKEKYFEESTTELSGIAFNAASVALEDFKTRKYNLKNYRIFIVHHKNQYEIVFLPNLAKGEKPSFGGGTQLGNELHYFVSKDGVLLKMSYAR